MKIIRDLGVIILASSVMFCSVINPGPVLAGSDQENLALQWKNSTFNKLSGNLSKPLTERVSKVPDDMLRDFIESDLSIGITTARAYTTRSAEQAELELIRRYTELLPPLYGKLFSEKLVAIFLIDNFAGAGLLSWLVDDDG